MKLTDKACKAAKPKEKPYPMADGGGLYLEIQPSGRKYWRMKYRFNDKQKKLAFGVYPEISLAKARERRAEAKELLSDGIDPMQYKKEQKLVKKLEAGNTFEFIAREWWEMKLPTWSESHAGYNIRRLERNIFPEIGHMPIKDITPPVLLDALRKTQKRGAKEVAYRCKSLCGQVFRYAIVTGRGERDPSQDLQDALEPLKKAHYSALEVKELPEFVKALHKNQARLYRHTVLATEMLMHTFVRTGELIGATWSEFDFDKKVWEIPAERMKMDRPHVVPLSTRVLAILEELQEMSEGSDYIFPSQISLKKHMSNNTILKAIERLGYKGRMTGHGFRALAMTAIQEELKYPFNVVDLQLAHVKKSRVDQAYDRTQFIKERTKMMQDWSDYLAWCLTGGDVIKFKAK